MYERPWNIAAYALSLGLLVLGPVLQTNVTAAAAVGLFAAWDLGYLLSHVALRGRTIEVALAQTQNIREHISYFLAFYGVLFAILFTQAPDRQAKFVEVCASAGIPLTLLVLPFVFALVPLLFFPIQLARREADETSAALKALVALSAFFQKVSIFLFAHVILRILSALSVSAL